jgi:anti-anti-sigma factor
MKLSIEPQNDVTIVVAEGRLDVTGGPELEASCKQVIQDGTKRLLLDMAAIGYISSAGLRSLLVVAKTIKAAGGSMILSGLNPAMLEIMSISGFDTILPHATDRIAALELLK